MIVAMPRVLVVDRSAQTRDVIADLLGELASTTWIAREGAPAALRTAIAAGQPYDVVVLEADLQPTASQVRELVTAGGGVRILLAAAGPDGAAMAAPRMSSPSRSPRRTWRFASGAMPSASAGRSGGRARATC